MELEGKVILVNETTVVSEKFKKRELVVETDDTYPQQIQVEFTQDNVDSLNSVKLGDNVKVQINLRGRAWTSGEGVTKYFNTIQGWRIEVTNGSKEAVTEDSSNLPF
jgi:translation initiation factor IF-3